MAQVLPIRAVVKPSILAGQVNGRLDDHVLVSTPGQAGGPVVRLCKPAARAWRAYAAAALTAGHVLKATSVADSYRWYEVQERTFRQRYTTTVITGTDRRWWQGQWWYRRPGYAPAAPPGGSNHGWGLAVDTGEERNGVTGTVESLDAATLAWMVANAARFGWSWELQSEPWHIRYWAGDAIPQAVIDYEKSAGTSTERDISMFAKYGDKGPVVEALQELILAVDPKALPRYGSDAAYGDETVTALKAIVGGDGKTFGPAQYVALHVAAAAHSTSGDFVTAVAQAMGTALEDMTGALRLKLAEDLATLVGQAANALAARVEAIVAGAVRAQLNRTALVCSDDLTVAGTGVVTSSTVPAGSGMVAAPDPA